MLGWGKRVRKVRQRRKCPRCPPRVGPQTPGSKGEKGLATARAQKTQGLRVHLLLARLLHKPHPPAIT